LLALVAHANAGASKDRVSDAFTGDRDAGLWLERVFSLLAAAEELDPTLVTTSALDDETFVALFFASKEVQRSGDRGEMARDLGARFVATAPRNPLARFFALRTRQFRGERVVEELALLNEELGRGEPGILTGLIRAECLFIIRDALTQIDAPRFQRLLAADIDRPDVSPRALHMMVEQLIDYPPPPDVAACERASELMTRAERHPHSAPFVGVLAAVAERVDRHRERLGLPRRP
jgi:hypothetical protein